MKYRRKEKRFTPSRTSPIRSNRACLCKNNTYNIKCCTGELRAQGIGSLTTSPVMPNPILTVSETTLPNLTYAETIDISNEVSYTINGTYLTSDVILVINDKFLMKTSSGSYVSSIILTPINGVVNEIITVKMISNLLTINSPFNGVITHNTNGINEIEVNLTGVVYKLFEANLSGYWKFDNDSVDYSNVGNDGIDTNMTYNGEYGVFNDSYVRLVDNDAYSFTDGVEDTSAVIAFGFIWDDTSGAQALLNKRGVFGDFNTKYEWMIYSNSTALNFTMSNSSNNPLGLYDIRIPVSTISLGQEHTLIITYDGSESVNGVNMYLDGVSVGVRQTKGNYDGQVNDTSDLFVGAPIWDLTRKFKGSIKQLAIWKGREFDSGELALINSYINNNTPFI